MGTTAAVTMTLVCTKCQKTRMRLYTTFVVYDWGSEHLTQEIQACGGCLLSQYLPCYRPNLNVWNVGKVAAYDDVNDTFTIQFDGCEPEHLAIDDAPFRSYADTYRQAQAKKKVPLKLGYTGRVKHWAEDLWDNRSSPSFSLPSHLTPPQLGLGVLRHPFIQQHDSFHLDKSPAATDFSTIQNSNQSERYKHLQCGKGGPRLWSIDEDQRLRRAIIQSKLPIKWPDIAKVVTGRTGKQCRERYYNHLKPTVKLAGWTPLEDSLICHTFTSIGSKWAAIARLLHGRTDNGVKNRFHHLRRRLEKQAAATPADAASIGSPDNKRLLLRAMDFTDRTDTAKALVRIITHAGKSKLAAPPMDYYDSKFGETKACRLGSICPRCGLILPSLQTGNSVCDVTEWCAACTTTPCYVTADLLRTHHQYRSESVLEEVANPDASVAKTENAKEVFAKG